MQQGMRTDVRLPGVQFDEKVNSSRPRREACFHPGKMQGGPWKSVNSQISCGLARQGRIIARQVPLRYPERPANKKNASPGPEIHVLFVAESGLCPGVWDMVARGSDSLGFSLYAQVKTSS